MDAPKKRRLSPLALGIASPVGHLGLLVLVLVAALMAGRRAWELFRDGGWFSWVLLLVAPMMLAVLIGLAVWLTTSKKAPSWPLVLPGFTLVLIALLGVSLGMGKVEGAISGASIDPSVKASIFAQGMAEALTLDLLGGLFAAIVSSAAAGVAGARALARVGAPRFGHAAIAGMVAGIVGLIVTMALHGVVRALRWGVPFGVLCAFTACVAATLSGAAMDSSSDDEESTSGAVSDLLVSASAALGGVAAGAMAGHAMVLSRGLSALGSVDPSQRTRMMSMAWTEAGDAALASWLHALPILLGGAAVLVMRPKLLGRGLRAAWGGLLAACVLVALPAVLPRVQTARLGAMLARMWEPPSAEDVELVQIAGREGIRAAGGRVVLVGRDQVRSGEVSLGPPSRLDSPEGCREARERLGEGMFRERWTLGVDKATAYARIACLAAELAPKRARRGEESGLALLVQLPVEPSPPAAPPFDKLKPEPGAIPVEVAAARSDEPIKSGLHVGRQTWTLQQDGKSERRPSGNLPELGRWVGGLPLSEPVLVTAEPETPASEVLAAVWMVAQKGRAVLGPASATPPALAPPEELREPASERAWLRVGALSVAGRLPPEVVQRVVRRSSGRFRYCYENGLRNNPKLEGRVKVRFVIGKEGTPSNVENGGSDLPDPKVVDCVVRAFHGLSYPAPDGGIVTVVVPLVFSPK